MDAVCVNRSQVLNNAEPIAFQAEDSIINIEVHNQQQTSSFPFKINHINRQDQTCAARYLVTASCQRCVAAQGYRSDSANYTS
eukprot:gene249-3625_t